MPTYQENIFAYNDIYAIAMLTDVATIVHNNGARRTDSPLNTGIVDYAELFFVYCFPNQESA